jgi:hypothetical protein
MHRMPAVDVIAIGDVFVIAPTTTTSANVAR